MNDVRIIKRYQNRKLYDTHQSCYVTLEEIAQIMGLPLGTVKTYIHRARLELKAALSDLDEREGD